MAEQGLILKPPTDGQVKEFLERYPKFNKDRATFALSVLYGCLSIGFADAASESTFRQWAIKVLQEDGSEASAAAIQKRWIALVEKQVPLSLRPSGMVEKDTVITLMRIWEDFGFGVISFQDAKNIFQIFSGAWDAFGECSDIHRQYFMLNGMRLFREQGITTPVALLVQQIWREIADQYRENLI